MKEEIEIKKLEIKNNADLTLLRFGFKVLMSYFVHPLETGGIIDESNVVYVVLCLPNEEKCYIDGELLPCVRILIYSHPPSSFDPKFDADYECDCYKNYLNLHGYNDIITLMNDSHVQTLLEFEDITCVLPVCIPGSNGELQIGLAVYRCYLDGISIANLENEKYHEIVVSSPTTGLHIKLSTGQTIAAIERRGWYASAAFFSHQITTSSAYGIFSAQDKRRIPAGDPTDPPILLSSGSTFAPTKHLESRYSTLTCIVKDTSENHYYFLTCDQVIKAPEENTSLLPEDSVINMIFAIFRANENVLHFPSIAFRKASVVNRCVRTLKNVHLDFLGKYFMDAVSKSDPSCYEDLFTTIDEMQHYLYGHQLAVPFHPSDMKVLNPVVRSDIISGRQQSIGINVTGGMYQLIKLREEDVENILTKCYQQPPPAIKHLCKNNVFSISTVVAYFNHRYSHELPVIKARAHDNILDEGVINRICHVKDISDLLQDQVISVTTSKSTTTIGKILYFQYLIHTDASSFGVRGDAGSMIFANVYDKQFPLGILVGGLSLGEYIATPIDYVLLVKAMNYVSNQPHPSHLRFILKFCFYLACPSFTLFLCCLLYCVLSSEFS